MKWTVNHDIYLTREILLIKPHQLKPGSKERGNAWSSIASDLNSIQEIHFTVSQKSVRDRYRLLVEKFKGKSLVQGRATESKDAKELEKLLANILDEANKAAFEQKEAQEQSESESSKSAEEIRKTAMESLGRHKRKMSEDDDDDNQDERPSMKARKRRGGSETLQYLHEKSEKEFTLRQQELEVRRKEIELQQQQMQQQQEASMKQNELMLALINKLGNS